MLNENILNEMEQRAGEKTHGFLVRQHTAQKILRQINSLEVALAHLMADKEYKGKVGSTL